MLESHEGREAFLAELENLPLLWRAVDVRVIATKFEGRWCNLVTRCRLDARVPGDIRPVLHLPESNSVAAWQTVLPLSGLGGLLASFGSGEAEIAGRIVSYRVGETQDPVVGEPYSPGRWNFSDRAAPFARDGQQWSELTFWESGDSIGHYFRGRSRQEQRLDQDLRTGRHPYDGLAGLAKHFAWSKDDLASNYNTSLQVIAPFEARLAQGFCSFRETLRIGIIAGSRTAAEACDLAFFLLDERGMSISESLSLESAEWDQTENGYVVQADYSVPASDSILLFLRIGGYCVDRLTLLNLIPEGQNTALEGYRTIDPDLEYFQSGLYPNPTARPNSTGFEQFVGRLFTFLGFRVDVFGADKRLSDSMDCIAYGDGHALVLAIECTLGSIDAGGKLGKLTVRAHALASALSGHTVHGVIATQEERSRVPRQELSRAADDGLIVLAREDLDELIQLATANKSMAATVGFLRSRIPERQEGAVERMPWSL